MSSIQFVSRKNGTYYFRRAIRLGSDKPFRLRLSMRTMCHARAKAIAPALVVTCDVLRTKLMATIEKDGLTAAQRAADGGEGLHRRQSAHWRPRWKRPQEGRHLDSQDPRAVQAAGAAARTNHGRATAGYRD